jgi:hypothetical protein
MRNADEDMKKVILFTRMEQVLKIFSAYKVAMGGVGSAKDDKN